MIAEGRPLGNLSQSLCTEKGIWMKNFGKDNQACKEFLQKSIGLDYKQMRYLQDRKLRNEELKVAKITSISMVLLTIGLIILAITQIILARK
jgi:hypothetical protein